MPRAHVVVEGENLSTIGHRDIEPDTECSGGELHKRLVNIRKGTGLKA
jgi:hypothetical protein